MSLGPRIFDELGDFQREIDKFFGNFTNELGLYEEVNTPLTDLYESQNEFKVVMNLPGFKKNEIKIESDADSMEIRVTKEEKIDKHKEKYHLKERRNGKILRRINFSTYIDPSKAKISLKDGVLTVIVPKAEKSKKTSLKIE